MLQRMFRMLCTGGASAGMATLSGSLANLCYPTLSTTAQVEEEFVHAVCSLVPAALSAASRYAGVAGAASLAVTEALQALRLCTQAFTSCNLQAPAMLQPAVCIALEQVVVKGLGMQTVSVVAAAQGGSSSCSSSNSGCKDRGSD